MKNKWKWVIAIFFLIFTPIAGVMHQIKGGGPSGSPPPMKPSSNFRLDEGFSRCKD
ncbi:hypothetical protein JOC70_003145 [Clostridium pascui]|uniref:hypothetical protein n=1 Tax=Clostridium pascui TaxID=46609 RepID=UPI00195B5626|nr:hypothetical protein [Clostridium pascui]MBM7871635.1 hypothetical protein [Clostridium pascui]